MQVTVSELANEDLIGIWLYGYEVWGNTLADEYLDDLYDAISSLPSNPYRYPEYQGVSIDSFRLMPMKSHLIAYEILETEILILRVLHKNMDTDTKMSGRS